MEKMVDQIHQTPAVVSPGRALFMSSLLAGVVLLVAVLPAEYGIDPTGVGRVLGLDALSDDAVEPVLSRQPLNLSDRAYRSDEIRLKLLPRQGVELKAVLVVGQAFVYQWRAEGGALHVDMHAEREGAAADEYTSYRIADGENTGAGDYRAAFNGAHGWYWENRGDTEVVLTLNVSGFYTELYMP